MKQTTWEPVGSWYDKKLGNSGDWAHVNIVIPKTIQLLSLTQTSSLLDLGCGQGILGRMIPKNILYIGIDISPTLIEAAKHRDRQNNHRYLIEDITNQISVTDSFSHCSCILTLDNIQHPLSVIRQASQHLHIQGVFVFVINHPCFRIPRQSSWGIDEQNKLQYRKINRYLSPLEIPITMYPGTINSPVTWTYHFPISTYSQWLSECGFAIEQIEEWASEKESVGKAAKMENRARSEFPLFLTIKARRLK